MRRWVEVVEVGTGRGGDDPPAVSPSSVLHTADSTALAAAEGLVDADGRAGLASVDVNVMEVGDKHKVDAVST